VDENSDDYLRGFAVGYRLGRKDAADRIEMRRNSWSSRDGQYESDQLVWETALLAAMHND